MIRSNALLAAKTLTIDLALAVLYFPVWWYTRGTLQAAAWAAGRVGHASHTYGYRIWLKNIFRPMYGQHDFAGRVISLFFRIIIIIYYTVILAVLSVIMAVLFVLWLVLPVFLAYMLVAQVGAILGSTGI